MLTPEQIADGWIEHDGGKCPVADDTHVMVIWRKLGALYPSNGPVNCFDWRAVSSFKPYWPEKSHDSR